MPSRKLTWKDISVCVDDGQRPYVLIKPPVAVQQQSCTSPRKERGVLAAIRSMLSGPSGEHLSEPRGRESQVARLSISHDGEYATAVVLLVDDGSL